MVYFSFELKGLDNLSTIDKINLFSGQLTDDIQTNFLEINLKFHIISRKTMSLIIPVPNPSSLKKDIILLDENCGKSENKFDNHAVVVGNIQEFSTFSNYFWINPAIKKEILDKYDGRNFGFIIIQIFPHMNNKTYGITYSHKIKHKNVLYLPIKTIPQTTPIALSAKLLNSIIPNTDIKTLNEIPENLSMLKFPQKFEIHSSDTTMPENDSLAFFAERDDQTILQPPPKK